MSERVVGKVASISSDRELIINKGLSDGVSEGMVFRVKGAPVDVLDPDTGEVLGQISTIKVVVKVAEVDQKFAIARTFRRRTVNVGGSNTGIGALAGVLQPPKYETRLETLRRDPRAGEPLSETDSVVQVGDIVEALFDGEDHEQTSTALWR